jgi:hypothetical protein
MREGQEARNPYSRPPFREGSRGPSDDAGGPGSLQPMLAPTLQGGTRGTPTRALPVGRAAEERSDVAGGPGSLRPRS